MTAAPPDVLRRQIMLTVYGARPELGTDGAGEVADALLSGPLAAQDGSGVAEGGSAVHVEGSERQGGVQGVTEADARTAEGLVAFYRGLREGGETDPAETGELAAAIARALAEERAKARAPFLALAERMGAEGDPAIRYYANRIAEMVENAP